ncbi:MAG: hypothetical protein J4N36_03450 [Chloroflexi bacterium]|nr:hypothetical protein [Chloroflexota bacterium]MCI0842797.1 hypothetical protein [Chloroflexota bacterium]
MAEKKQPKQKTPKTNEVPAWKRKDAMRNQKKAGWANQSAPRPVHRPQKH